MFCCRADESWFPAVDAWMADTGRPLEAYRAHVAPDTQVYYNEWSVTASGLLNCRRGCLVVGGWLCSSPLNSLEEIHCCTLLAAHHS